jgi:xanthine dehydrogenase accessory factor
VTPLARSDFSTFTFPEFPVLVRGGGDLGSGAAFRIARAGLPVLIAEVAKPHAVRLGACFARAVWDGEATVDGLVARLVSGPEAIIACWKGGVLPVIVAPRLLSWKAFAVRAVVDARMLKRAGEPLGPASPLTVGLGPGFRAGVDCHAVVETQRGHWLGRVYWEGGASEDSGMPDAVRGHAGERVIRAPIDGVVRCLVTIGDMVRAGTTVAEIGASPVRAAFEGVVRGLIHDGVEVTKGLKIGDIDPRGVREHCFTISDKALAVGGGALSAILESQPFRDSIPPVREPWPPAGTATTEEVS